MGDYWLRPGQYFAGESIALGDGVFTRTIFTDAMDDPRLKDNPLHGRFELNGCLLELRFSDGTVSHKILTQHRGRFLMWSPLDYEEHLRTGLAPPHVLYQKSPR
jgi:hypothetical protein